MTVLLCAVGFLSMTGGLLGEEPSLWRDLFGAPPVTAVTGNSGLTAGVDAVGRVVSCRWPSPGYHDQLSFSPGGGAGTGPIAQGLQWGVKIGDEIHWLTEEGWSSQQSSGSAGAPSIITESQNVSLGLHIDQSVFVHSGKDVLVWRIGVRGANEPPSFCFFADLTPCTRLLPEAPVADWALDDLNDFAAFIETDKDRVWHFRPRQPGVREWERARSLAKETLPPADWGRFGEGTWVVYGSTNRTRGAACFDVTGAPPPSTLLDTGAAPSGKTSCVGQCASLMWIDPANDAGIWRGTVCLAFGKNHEDAADSLSYALESGDARLEQETSTHWTARTDAANFAPGIQPQTAQRLRHAVTRVLVAMDRSSGAIVRAPVTQPPYALDWPRYGIWTTLALDLAGYHAEAEHHLQFYLEAMRDGTRPTAPAGSLPSALYANGVDALPSALLERDTTGFLLGALWRHGATLDQEAQATYFRSVWPKVEMGAEFLASRSLDSSGRILPSYQPACSADGTNTESLVIAFAGLESAARIAEIIEQTLPPPARRALQDVQSSIQLQFYALAAPWTWPPGLAYWIDAIVPAGHWLRKPLRTGDTAWPPLSDAAHESPAGVIEIETSNLAPDALAAALEIVILLRDGSR